MHTPATHESVAPRHFLGSFPWKQRYADQHSLRHTSATLTTFRVEPVSYPMTSAASDLPVPVCNRMYGAHAARHSRQATKQNTQGQTEVGTEGWARMDRGREAGTVGQAEGQGQP